ncbi:MAG: protein kinase [Myxococcota bacterium]
MARERQLTNLPSLGEVVGRYRILGEIAHGGMSAVYSASFAEEKDFERIFAVKFLLPHLATDATHVDMFLDEARIASRIQHRNVVQVFDVGQDEGVSFLVMEYLEGQPLSVLATRSWDAGPPLDVQLACHVMAQAAAGLHAAHTAKGRDGEPLEIVHRDFNPHNIHVGYDGTVKVVDFGVAAARGRRTQTRSGEIKGKLSYMAPEQISLLHPTTAATDVFALGITLWELFVGRRLFSGESDARTLWNVMNREVPDPILERPELPEGIRSLIMACLSRDPMDRPRSAGLVASELQRHSRLDDGERLEAVMDRLFGREKSESANLRDEAVTISMSLGPLHPPQRSRWPVAAGLVAGVVVTGVLGAAVATLALPSSSAPEPDSTSMSALEEPPREPETTGEAEPAPSEGLRETPAGPATEPPADAVSERRGESDPEMDSESEPEVASAIGMQATQMRARRGDDRRARMNRRATSSERGMGMATEGSSAGEVQGGGGLLDFRVRAP